MNTNNQYPKPTTFPYNGFLYTYNFELNEYKILPDKYKPSQETLFKYYSLDNNSVDSLLNRYIYVSHPMQLNDAYDSSEHFILFDEDEINKIILNGLSISELKKKEILKDNRQLSKANRELIYSRLGIFSMTETPDNILMWAHYTRNRGFAIEFNYEKLKDTSTGKILGQFPMNYVEKIEPIKLSKIDIHCALLMQSNIKQKNWEYENERRLLIECKDGEYSLPSYLLPDAKERKSYYSIDAIESIWLATKFLDEDEYSIDIKSKIGCIRLKGNDKSFKSILLCYISDNKIRTNFRLQNTMEELTIECIIEYEFNNTFRINLI